MKNESKFFECVYFFVQVLFLVRVVQYGWVTDDAFITFRSVLNFVAGDGAVFNIGERVQSYTHPFWFMLLSLGGFLDTNLYFFAIFLGIAFSGLTIPLLPRIHRAIGASEGYFLLILVVGVLAASESFISFATSGLENSATYFLVALAVLCLVEDRPRRWFYLSISLAVLNRFDNIFLLFPLMAGVLYEDFRERRLKVGELLVAFLPLLVWHAFSLVYYGFLFPNTKYAKVGGRSLANNATSGLDYIFDSFQTEPHMALLLVGLPVLAVVLLKRRMISESRRRTFALMLCGVCLHILYVVFVAGGDFMRGRFFTVTLLYSAISLLFLNINPSFAKRALILGLCGVGFTVSAWIGAKEIIFYPVKNVANERNYYKAQLGLNLEPKDNYTTHPWALMALSLGDAPRVLGVVGQRGYWMPRSTYLLDPVGLTDAFVARLKIVDNSRSGHFQREIPREYILQKINGVETPVWEDRGAQELSQNIENVIASDDFLSAARLRSMWWLWTRYGF